MSPTRLLPLLLAIGVLSACVSQPTRAPLPAAERPAALARQQARESMLAAHPRWTLEGRVGLSNGQRGGSGRIDWQQDGATFAVALSAPITRQSWRIAGDNGSVRLEGLEGGPRVGSDASAVLREATGWEIPVAALTSWVRGARAPQAGDARLQFSADGRLARLEQDGWTLDYDDWRPEPALGIELPHRISARRDPATVRLVVDAWGDGQMADASGP